MNIETIQAVEKLAKAVGLDSEVVFHRGVWWVLLGKSRVKAETAEQAVRLLAAWVGRDG